MNSFWRSLAAALIIIGCMPALDAQDDEPAPKPTPKLDEKEFRVFKSKDGKTLRARVVSRIDDARYTVETPDGKSFTLNVENLSRTDQTFLELWEPGAIFDLASADLPDVLEKMGYGAAALTTTGNWRFVTARVGDQDLKFVLAQGQAFSTLDTKVAGELGLELAPGGLSFRDPGGKEGRSQQGTVEDFRLGDINFGPLLFQVIDLSQLGGDNLPNNTAGTIGGDLLKKANALIDYNGQSLYVRKDD